MSYEDRPLPGHPAQAGDEDQSTPVPGDGSAVHAPARPAAAHQAGDAEQSVPRPGGAAGRRGGDGAGREGEGEGEKEKRRRSTGRRSSWTASRPAAAARSTRRRSTTSRSRWTRATCTTTCTTSCAAAPLAAGAAAGRGDHRQHRRERVPDVLARGGREGPEPVARGRGCDWGEDGRGLPPFTRWRRARRCCGSLQALRPAGIAARDLRECLLLQLQDAELEDTLAYRIVRDYFEQLINHRWSEISKELSITPKDVQTRRTRWPSWTRSRASSTRRRRTTTSRRT
jgi:hypothetical protein